MKVMQLAEIADRFRQIGCGTLVEFKGSVIHINAPAKGELLSKNKWGRFFLYYTKIVKHPLCLSCVFESHAETVFVRATFKAE